MGHHINSIGYRAGVSYLWRFLVISSRNYEYFQNFGLVFFFFFKYIAFFFTFKYKMLFHGRGFAYSHFYVFNSVNGFVLHIYLYDKYFLKFLRRLDSLIIGHADNFYLKNQQLLYYQQKEKDDNYYRVSKLRYVGKELKKKIYKRFYVQHYSNKVKIAVDSLFAFTQKYVLKNLKNIKSFGLYLNKFGVFFRNIATGSFNGHVYKYGVLRKFVFYIYFLYKTFNFNVLLARGGNFGKAKRKRVYLSVLNNWKFFSLYKFLLKRAKRRIYIFNKYGLFRKIILESSNALFWYRRMFRIMELYGKIKRRRFIMKEGLYRLGTRDEIMYRNVFGVNMLGSGLNSKMLAKLRRKQWVLFCGNTDKLLNTTDLNISDKIFGSREKKGKNVVINKVANGSWRSSRVKRSLLGSKRFKIFWLVKRLKHLFRNFYTERLVRFSRYLKYRVDKKFMERVNSVVSLFNNKGYKDRQNFSVGYQYNPRYKGSRYRDNFKKSKSAERFSKYKNAAWVGKSKIDKDKGPVISEGLLLKIKEILDRYPTPPNPLTDENFLNKIKARELAEKEEGHKELLATQKAALARLRNEDIASNNAEKSYAPELRRLLNMDQSKNKDRTRFGKEGRDGRKLFGKQWQRNKENKAVFEKNMYREGDKKYYNNKYWRTGKGQDWQKKPVKHWDYKQKSTEVFKDNKKGNPIGFESTDKKSYWTLHVISNALDIQDRFTITRVYERIKVFFFILYRYGLEKIKVPVKLRRSPMYAYMNDPLARLQKLFKTSTEIFFKRHPFLDRNYQMEKMMATQEVQKTSSGELLFFRYIRNTIFFNFQNFFGFNGGEVVDKSFFAKSYKYFGLVFLYYYAYWGRKRAQGYPTRYRPFDFGKRKKTRIYVKTYNEVAGNRRNFFKFFYQYFFFFSDLLNLRHRFSLYKVLIYLFYKILIRIILAIEHVKRRLRRWKNSKKKREKKRKKKNDRKNDRKNDKKNDAGKNDVNKNKFVSPVSNQGRKGSGFVVVGSSFGNNGRGHSSYNFETNKFRYISRKKRNRKYFGFNKRKKIARFLGKHMRYYKREVGTLVNSRYRYKDIPEMMHKSYVIKFPVFVENSFGFVIKWLERRRQKKKDAAALLEKIVIKEEVIQENILLKYSKNGKMEGRFFLFRLFFAYLKKSSEVFSGLHLKVLLYSRKIYMAFQLRLFRWFLRVYKRNFGARFYKIFASGLQKLIKFKLNKLLWKEGVFVSDVFINPLSGRSVTVEVLLGYYKYKMRRNFNFKSVTYFFVRRFARSARRNYIRGFFAEGAGRFTKKQRAAFIKVMYGKARFSTIRELLRFGYTNYVTEHGTCGISLWLNYWGVKVKFRAPRNAVFNAFKFKLYS